MSTSWQNVLSQDRRFARASYEEIEYGIDRAQNLKHGDQPNEEDPDRHINGVEMLEGIAARAQDEYGLLAKSVFSYLGFNSADDILDAFEILVRHELLLLTPDESVLTIRQACEGYDLGERLANYKFPSRRKQSEIG